MKISEFLKESLDDPLDYQAKWDDVEIPEDEREDYDGRDTYPARVQKAYFTSPSGTKFLWYAKQGNYDDTYWEIAFGVIESTSSDGRETLDIGKTGTGNQMRIFATVLDIMDDFTEYFEHDVMTIMFTADKSEGMSRQRLYSKILGRRTPDGFSLDKAEDQGNEVMFVLSRG